jgi:5-methyltetrahydropteroyltriglutamate--homocysteine methyltransferase
VRAAFEAEVAVRGKCIRRENDAMAYGRDRILATHAGSLPRSAELTGMVYARGAGRPHDDKRLPGLLRDAVREAVRRQVECGIDIVNDGELGKTNFTQYGRERLSGFEVRPLKPGEPSGTMSIIARDRKRFAKFFEKTGGWAVEPTPRTVCVEPIRYVGEAAMQTDIANFKAALEGVDAVDAFLPAVTPGSIEHWLRNEHYKSDEAFLYAIADAMKEEYRGIVDAGFLLQIDDPDLPDGWQMFPDMSVADYRKYAELRVEVLNYALKDIPRERVRLHVCWGSNHGPHQNDLALAEIVDIIFRTRAGQVSIEASNPRHEHEWRVFETFKLPADTVIIPGVVGHATDFIEHPELVADRLCRYADLVGRDNVMAGTDCGIGTRVGEAEIAWAKLEAMAEGCRIATKRLWGSRKAA